METLLSLLKFAGIVLSGVLGILTTLTETHKKVQSDGKKRLNRWGKWAFAFTIAGFAMALGAHLAEELKKRKDEIESRSRTEQQIKQANLSLRSIERLLTPIHALNVLVRFEIPTNSVLGLSLFKPITHLSQRMQRAAQTLSWNIEDVRKNLRWSTNDFLETVRMDFMNPNPSRDFSSFDQPNAFRIPLPRSALFKRKSVALESNELEFLRFTMALEDDKPSVQLPTMGVIRFASDSNLVLFFTRTEARFIDRTTDFRGVDCQLVGTNVEVRVDPLHVDTKFWTLDDNDSESAKARFQLSGITNLDLWIEFRMRGRPLSAKPSLSIFSPHLTNSVQLRYSAESGSLFLDCNYSCTATNILAQGMQSLPDLARATIRVASDLPFRLSQPNAKLLREVELQFPTATVRLTNFYAGTESDIWAETTMPPALNGFPESIAE
jgi:hypothetical protein